MFCTERLAAWRGGVGEVVDGGRRWGGGGCGYDVSRGSLQRPPQVAYL